MKRNLTFIALIATALLCSCGSSEKTENVEAQPEKPKVKIAQTHVEAVPQLEEYATTVEAEVRTRSFLTLLCVLQRFLLRLVTM